MQSYSEAKVGEAAGGSMVGILGDFLYLFVASLILGMVFGLGAHLARCPAAVHVPRA